MSHARGFDGGLISRLDSLVSSGTLTSAQETAINDAIKATMPQRVNQLNSLLTAGTITSAQETAIKSAMQTARQSGTKTDYENGS